MTIPGYFFVILWGAALSTAICLLALVLTRQHRLFPVFSIYLSFLLAATVVQSFDDAKDVYWRIYLISSFLDYVIELAVMWELARHIVAFVNKELYRPGRAVAVLMSLAFLAIGVVVLTTSHFPKFSPDAAQMLVFDSFFQTVRTLFLAVLLLLSIVLGIRWKHLPVRLVAYLSIYSSASLAARAVQQYGATLPHMRIWFQAAEVIPIIFWSALMVMISLQCVGSLRYQPIPEFSS